ncbi:MAG: peptide chain release factor N(5)-glutamine methyltransferase [Saprospiraceae bacterium]
MRLSLFLFSIMTVSLARNSLVEQLMPRYGEGEAKAIARIVFEDAFDHGRAFGEVRFAEILQRLLAGEPVQYVLGEADFFGLKFTVSPDVLIPRQETEELVAWVLEHLKTFSPVHAPRLLDIGLGSGCIGITLKKKMPGLELFGLEKSPSALAIATENAKRILNIPISQYPNFQFLHGDILNRSEWALFPQLDVVVSNPPYIPHSEKHLVPEHVMAHEPALALFVDDPDPLLFYRAIADFSLGKLRPDGVLFFECNEFNAAEVADMLREKGFSKVELRKDLSGAERMVKGLLQSD